MRSGLDGSGDERLKLFLFFWWTYPTYPVNFCCWLIQLKQRLVDEFPLFLWDKTTIDNRKWPNRALPDERAARTGPKGNGFQPRLTGISSSYQIFSLFLSSSPFSSLVCSSPCCFSPYIKFAFTLKPSSARFVLSPLTVSVRWQVWHRQWTERL